MQHARSAARTTVAADSPQADRRRARSTEATPFRSSRQRQPNAAPERSASAGLSCVPGRTARAANAGMTSTAFSPRIALESLPAPILRRVLAVPASSHPRRHRPQALGCTRIMRRRQMAASRFSAETTLNLRVLRPGFVPEVALPINRVADLRRYLRAALVTRGSEDTDAGSPGGRNGAETLRDSLLEPAGLHA